jgi:hypothetical protein
MLSVYLIDINIEKIYGAHNVIRATYETDADDAQNKEKDVFLM